MFVGCLEDENFIFVPCKLLLFLMENSVQLIARLVLRIFSHFFVKTERTKNYPRTLKGEARYM